MRFSDLFRRTTWAANDRAGSAGIGFVHIPAPVIGNTCAVARTASGSVTVARASAGGNAKPRPERAHLLRQRLRGDAGGGRGAAGLRVSWDAVRDAVGLEVAVIIEEIARLLEDVVRDAVHRQVGVLARESRQVLPTGRRDDMVSAARAP